MSSFSNSEISNMLSSKKYKIQRGDNLITLADKFQRLCPTLNKQSRSSVMDEIYKSNPKAFGGNKDILLEGKELELTFVATIHKSNFRFDTSKKEYIFTDAQYEHSSTG